jgi:hypothetical protein
LCLIFHVIGKPIVPNVSLVTAKMLNYEYGADLIVIISDYSYSPDYTIFHNSKILSLKEAIAIIVFQDYKFNE